MSLTPALTRYRRDVFAVDLRSLAALRIAVALITILDLIRRIPSIEAFYTDAGVLTRQMSRDSIGSGVWSVYWLDGSLAFAETLIVINLIFAVCLLFGFRTRLAVAACLVLAWSLQMRMPWILTAGHVMQRMMLVWFLFLPVSAVWSWDARRGQEFRWPNPLANVATAAIILQLICLYLFSGIAKWNDQWFGGDALITVFSSDVYAKPLAGKILESPWLRDTILPLLQRSVPWVEVVGPWLLLAPGRLRVLRLIVFLLAFGLHVGVWLTLSIGIFSPLSICCWLVFVPTWFWDRLPFVPARQPGSRAPDSSRYHAGQLICACTLVYVLWYNVANIQHPATRNLMPSSLRLLAQPTMLIQEFRMFGRILDTDDAFFDAAQFVRKNPVKGPRGRGRLPMLAPGVLDGTDHYLKRLAINMIYFRNDRPQLVESILRRVESYGAEDRVNLLEPVPEP